MTTSGPTADPLDAYLAELDRLNVDDLSMVALPEPDPDERAGFYTFLEMARDVGELDHVPEFRFISTEIAPV